MVIIVVIATAAAACGGDGASVHSRSAANLVRSAPADCQLNYKTLAIATDAFVALTGGLPGSESDLVTANLMRSESDDFDLMLGRNEYRIVPVGQRCEGFDPGSAGGQTTQTSVGLPDCNVQRRTIEVAIQAYDADKGVAPVSESDLVPDYMLVDSVGFDLVSGAIVPVPGMRG